MFLFVSLNVFGQTDNVLKKIFFGLDLRLSDSANAAILRKDTRFVTPKQIVYLGNGKTLIVDALDVRFEYYGRVLDNGIVTTKSDSTIIYLSNNPSEMAPCMDCPNDSFSSMPFTSVTTTLYYYYHSDDSVEKAYSMLLSFFKKDGVQIEDENKNLISYSNTGDSIIYKIYDGLFAFLGLHVDFEKNGVPAGFEPPSSKIFFKNDSLIDKKTLSILNTYKNNDFGNNFYPTLNIIEHYHYLEISFERPQIN